MLCLRYVALFSAVACAAWAQSAVESQESPALKVLTNVVDRCLSSDDPTVCLEEETASAVGRALKTDSVSLLPGVTLQRSPGTSRFDERREGRAVEHMTPYDKMWHYIEKFFNTRNLNVNLGEAVGEARKKRKKFAQYFGIALATAAAILVPLKLKLIAWMAATALMTGKLALVIASLVGLKKLVSKPHEETTHVHYDGHRSDANAHFLAYGGQQAPAGTIEYPA